MINWAQINYLAGRYMHSILCTLLVITYNVSSQDDKITELQDDIDCYKSDVTELRDELNQTKIKMSKIMQSPQGLTIASRGTYVSEK